MKTNERFALSLFRHKTEVRVRNYEVDWQGIVHNAVYLQYFEVGRVEYLRQRGTKLDLGSVRGKNKLVLVRNEIDYLMPLTFDSVVTVHTRISKIGNTSFWMEGILEVGSAGIIAATNVAYHVWLDYQTNKPKDVGDDFRKSIEQFEGDRCAIHWPVRKV